MSIEYLETVAIFRDFVGADEAEGLVQWLQESTHPTVDLSSCRHLHAANLQVLLAAKAPVSAWPEDPDLCRWLVELLEPVQIGG